MSSERKNVKDVLESKLEKLLRQLSPAQQQIEAAKGDKAKQLAASIRAMVDSLNAYEVSATLTNKLEETKNQCVNAYVNASIEMLRAKTMAIIELVRRASGREQLTSLTEVCNNLFNDWSKVLNDAGLLEDDNDPRFGLSPRVENAVSNGRPSPPAKKSHPPIKVDANLSPADRKRTIKELTAQRKKLSDELDRMRKETKKESEEAQIAEKRRQKSAAELSRLVRERMKLEQELSELSAKLQQEVSVAQLQQARECLEESRFDEARSLLRGATANAPTDGAAWYLLACAESMVGNATAGLDCMRKVLHLAYPEWRHAATDDRLAAVRELPEWKALYVRFTTGRLNTGRVSHLQAQHDVARRGSMPADLENRARMLLDECAMDPTLLRRLWVIADDRCAALDGKTNDKARQWRRVRDGKHHFYHNVTTQQSQWTPPEDVDANAIPDWD